MPRFTTPRKASANAASSKKLAILAGASPGRRATLSVKSPQTRAMTAANSPKTRSKSTAMTPKKVSRATVFCPMPKAAAPKSNTHHAPPATAQQATSQNPPPTRQPPRCTKCDGRPLRSQCLHTALGRAFLENREPVTPKGPRCKICAGAPIRKQCCHTISGRNYLKEQRLLADLQQSELGAESPTQETPIRDLSTNSGDLEGEVVETIGNSAPASNSTGSFPSPENSTGGSSTENQVMSSYTSSNPSSPSDEDALLTPCPKKKATFQLRKRATMSNPIFGMIQNSKRGNKHYAMYRTHMLPKPRQSSQDVSRRFLRQMNKLLQRCEDISIETGCWLFLGAQHVTSRGGAFSYASPRICREARESTEEIATSFNSMATHLLNARRSEAIKLQRQLEEMQERKLSAEMALQAASVRIAEYQKRYGDLDAVQVPSA